MKKKYYILSLLTGALLIFFSLPLANYYTDQWRVLHHDYNNSYRGISPNKSFLKVKYLLDNKEKYDTILMGSSRSGYMDSRLISENAYNMKFNFALAKIHLHNLKTLLKNKVKFKNLWLGINDYAIWKNPNDHESDFQRKMYKDNYLDQLDTYSFYLLKKIDSRDIKIFQEKYRLYPSEELTNPDKANMKTARSREKYAITHPSIWIKRMTYIKPTLLGYSDDTYRIDKSVNELKKIKILCEQNHIKLTAFIYPSYYKTYLQFNQYKIEEFKKKLSTVLDFYDFYELNDISLNELNWQDSSHFHASIGDYIIKSIQENRFLVTKENIDSHIKTTRRSIKNVIKKPLPIKYIYKFNGNIDLNYLKSIFDLKDKKYKFSKNDQFELSKDEDSIIFTAKNIDPTLILDKTISESENIILTCKIESDKRTTFQIFYKKTDQSEYNEKDAFNVSLKKGLNEFNLLIPSKYLNNELRIDLVNNIGTYRIKEFSIYSSK